MLQDDALVAFDARPVTLVDDELPRVSYGFGESLICAYPQAKRRKETALAEKMADSRRFGR